MKQLATSVVICGAGPVGGSCEAPPSGHDLPAHGFDDPGDCSDLTIERAFSELHWSDWNDTNVRLATMGEQILSLVDGVPGLGVAVHDKTGELACKGTLELPEGVQVDQFYGRPVELEGRDQVVVGGRRRVGDPEDYAYESMLLLIEALED